MVWGDDVLCLTVARAGFWDRRAGKPFGARATFSRVQELWEANDEAGLRALFAETSEPNMAPRPQQIGGGRFEVRFDGDFAPYAARLNLERGELEVELRDASGAAKTVVIYVHPDAELCVLEGEGARVTVRSSWEWVGPQLLQWGFSPPDGIEISDGGGFVQSVPDGESLALVWREREGRILIASALSEDVEEAAKGAVATAARLPDTRPEFFWKRYWRDVPRVHLPDESLNRKWLLGLWKQAGLTAPNGIAATLQGPWMEEYQLPPWSNDYHFNINAQLIYYPALMTNRLEHFAPLWAMIREWLPTLSASGEAFFEAKGALMLPHAVDDRCGVVGQFWAGTIDHGCTAWVGQMAWLCYRYGGDKTLLREIAWPLLKGAFEGYFAMSEERDGHLSLPMSVSPEYRGDAMNAAGRDASFQLAAWHMTAQLLPRAAKILGEPQDLRWQEVEDRLPLWSSITIPPTQWDVRQPRPTRIALWEGLELEESHRHHAHLAAIWPFCSVDPLEYHETIANSISFWNTMGAGQWTGWCLPWASILCSRFNLPDAALAWLGWLDHFTNVGEGTRHNADFSGAAAWDNGEMSSRRPYAADAEVMQADAAMGFLVAVCELLVQTRGEVLHVLPRTPRKWRGFHFDGILAEGGFLVGATVERGRTVEVRVESKRGESLQLAHGLGETFSLDGVPLAGAVWQGETRAGQTLVFRGETG